MKFLEQTNLERQKDEWLPSAGVSGGKLRVTANGYVVAFEGDENI